MEENGKVSPPQATPKKEGVHLQNGTFIGIAPAASHAAVSETSPFKSPPASAVVSVFSQAPGTSMSPAAVVARAFSRPPQTIMPPAGSRFNPTTAGKERMMPPGARGEYSARRLTVKRRRSHPQTSGNSKQTAKRQDFYLRNGTYLCTIPTKPKDEAQAGGSEESPFKAPTAIVRWRTASPPPMTVMPPAKRENVHLLNGTFIGAVQSLSQERRLRLQALTPLRPRPPRNVQPIEMMAEDSA